MSGTPSPSRSARRRCWPALSAKLTGRLCPTWSGAASAHGGSICCSIASTAGSKRSASAPRGRSRDPARLARLLTRSARNGRSRLRHRGDDPDRLARRAARRTARSQPARRGRPSRICRRWSTGSRTASAPDGSTGVIPVESDLPERSLRQRGAARPAGRCDLARALAAAEPAAVAARADRDHRAAAGPSAGAVHLARACAGGSGGPTDPSASSANGGGTTAKPTAVRDYFQVEDEAANASGCSAAATARTPPPARSALVPARRVRDDALAGPPMPNCRSRRISRSCAARPAPRSCSPQAALLGIDGARHRRPPFARRHRAGARGGQGHRRARSSSAAGST